MSLQEQQNFLAKLYTDAELRRAFLSAPEKIGAENDLNEREIAEIAEIMPEELNFFADSLFWKRLREAEKFLPVTRKILGEEFSGKFREFSQTFNPRTVKKHFEDALEFCRFLRHRNISELVGNAAKFEQTKLEFFGLEKRIAVCRLNFDFRNLSDSGSDKPFELPEKKQIFVVWLRLGKSFRQFYF